MEGCVGDHVVVGRVVRVRRGVGGKSDGFSL
jgi:hypothetical protein